MSKWPVLKLQTSPLASLHQLKEVSIPPNIHLRVFSPQHVSPGKVILCLTDNSALTTFTHVFSIKTSEHPRSHISRSLLQLGLGPCTLPPYTKLHQSSRLFHHSSNTGQNDASLTHTDAQGRASMVDVSGKTPSCRTASAQATVLLGPTAFLLLRENQLVKGDALAVAQIAGILGSKQTSNLIPLCHPLPLDHVSVTFDLDEVEKAAIVTATCRTTGRTGVEMEALTAVSVAALTVYDMCKAVSQDIIITDIKLISKTGGKRDFNRIHNKTTNSTVNL